MSASHTWEAAQFLTDILLADNLVLQQRPWRAATASHIIRVP